MRKDLVTSGAVVRLNSNLRRCLGVLDKVRLSFIRPGKPNENAYIESFNGKFRDECLNEHWFVTMAHARRFIETWRAEYNTERPHGSLGDLTPEEYADRCIAQRREALSLTADSSPERA